MGKNTITNIMKVSVAGISLKESEKKVYESLCKKNNSQEATHSSTQQARITNLNGDIHPESNDREPLSVRVFAGRWKT